MCVCVHTQTHFNTNICIRKFCDPVRTHTSMRWYKNITNMSAVCWYTVRGAIVCICRVGFGICFVRSFFFFFLNNSLSELSNKSATARINGEGGRAFWVVIGYVYRLSLVVVLKLSRSLSVARLSNI